MDTPIFKLENVVKGTDELEDFSGPLNVILQLLSKNKVEIRDISVSQILEQYLEYLDKMAEMDLEIASEFVAMASHLVYIKTKMLLTNNDEISELEQLISTLEQMQKRDVYTRVCQVIDELALMYNRGAGLITKPPEVFSEVTEYKYSHKKEELFESMLKLIESNDERTTGVRQTVLAYPKKIVYSIAERAEKLVSMLKQFGTLRVAALLSECEDRSSMVASFIAILELCSSGSILVTGEDENLSITYTGAGSDTVSDDYDVLS